MAKVGRPRLAKNKGKNEIITLRVAPIEHDLLRKAANRANQKLSAWIRKVLLQAADID